MPLPFPRGLRLVGSGRHAGGLLVDGLDELEDSRQAIRVYLDTDELLGRRRKLQSEGLPVGPISEGDGARRFLCADPDGYVVEFRGRD